MASVVETGYGRSAVQFIGMKEARPRIPAEYGRPLPADPYLDLLSPETPVSSHAPSRLRTPFRPFLEVLYAQAAIDAAQVARRMAPEDGAIGEHIVFTSPSVQLPLDGQERMEVDQNEIGQNFFKDPRTRLHFATPILRGTPNTIVPIGTSLSRLTREGLYSHTSHHIHGRKFLPIPSPGDWGAFRFDRYNGTIPWLKDMTIAGDGMQVKAFATDGSHPLMDNAEREAFERFWNKEYANALDGSPEYDEVTIRLAESMRVPLYVSTDMQIFDLRTPREIVHMYRTREQQQPLRPAA